MLESSRSADQMQPVSASGSHAYIPLYNTSTAVSVAKPSPGHLASPSMQNTPLVQACIIKSVNPDVSGLQWLSVLNRIQCSRGFCQGHALKALLIPMRANSVLFPCVACLQVLWNPTCSALARSGIWEQPQCIMGDVGTNS